MKRSLIVLILSLALFACNKQKPIDNSISLGGQITNFSTDVILINQSSTPGNADSVFIDEQGFYLFKKDLDAPSYFSFSYGDVSISLFLEPGDDLTLNFDATDAEGTTEYIGTGSVANNYLKDMAELRESLQPNTKGLFLMNEEDFIAKLDSIKQAKLTFFENTFTEETAVSEMFLTSEKAKILYAKANIMIMYPRLHAYYSGNDSFEASDNFDAYLDQLNLNDPSLLAVSNYMRFLNNYLQQKADDIYEEDSNMQKDDNGWTLAQFKAIDTEFDNDAVKEKLAFNIMSDQIRYQGIKDIDLLMAMYKQYNTNDSLQDILDSRITEWESIAEGKPAPGFTYPDLDSSLHSLSDFKGKYVYIDVWATWCGPCRGEIPYLKKLEEEFKEKNVQFISISVDDSKDDWVKMETTEELGGLQLYAGGWESDIAVNFLIHSIPRFILIDTEGNILDNNAPRPSGTIADVLNSLDNI